MSGLSGYHADSRGQSSSIDTEAGRKFDTALFSAIDALDEGKVSYAVIGGIAASNLGRPRSTQDIDIFVRPEDAEAILDLLERKGFRTEKTNPTWLFKAFKEEVLIDIIFRSEGGFYFDDEMRQKAVTSTYHGRTIRMVSPEDFVLIKCAVHSEEGPHHWHDALSVLSQSRVDWDYLFQRSRKAPRRLLALLIYAQSDDIWVPNTIIQKLHRSVFEQHNHAHSSEATRETEAVRAHFVPQPDIKDLSEPYLAAKIREELACSERAGALGVDVQIQGNQVLVRGQSESEDQHQAIMQLVREMAPGFYVSDQLNVTLWQAPTETQDLQ